MSFRFSLAQGMLAMLVIILVAWAVPRPVPWGSLWVFGAWSGLLVAQALMQRWARLPREYDDALREDARYLVEQVSRVNVLIWALLLVGMVMARTAGGDSSSTVSMALRLMSPTVLLWLPICLVANILSGVLYWQWRDTPMVLVRLVSPASMLMPLVWYVLDR